jgi:beta-glucosidase
LGIGRTFRYADRIPPGLIRWHFGFGLSYTSWTYDHLVVTLLPSATQSQAGSNSINVSAAVTNAGSIAAYEVVQLYIAVPSISGVITPKWDLQGFSRVWVEPGNVAEVVFSVATHQLTTVLTNGTRVVSSGEYRVWVSGHQPDDPNGQSNVLAGSFEL